MGNCGEGKVGAAVHCSSLMLGTLITGSAFTGHGEVGPKQGLNLVQPHAAVPQKGDNVYADLMLHTYELMMDGHSLPNYISACCQLPSNLCSSKWEALICTAKDTITVDCLKFGYPVEC